MKLKQLCDFNLVVKTNGLDALDGVCTKLGCGNCFFHRNKDYVESDKEIFLTRLLSIPDEKL